MLDEPTVGLDPVLRRDLWDLFRRLAGEGRTLFVSSHVMDEATRCDRLLLLRDGRILSDSTPPELLAAHRRRRRRAAPSSRSSTRRAAATGATDGVRGMNAGLTVATAARILRQLRSDHRTVALMVVVPCVLLGLLPGSTTGLPGDIFNRIGPALLGVFPFVVMFIVTSVATLRERTTGTLERLLTTPAGQGRLHARLRRSPSGAGRGAGPRGHGFAVWVCGLDIAGPLWLLVVVAVFDAVLGHGPGPARQRLRAHRVPGRAVHAGVHAPAVPALRPARAARPAAAGARGDLERAAAVLRRRRHEGRHGDGRPLADVLPSLGVIACGSSARSPGQPHPAAPHPLTLSRREPGEARTTARRDAVVPRTRTWMSRRPTPRQPDDVDASDLLRGALLQLSDADRVIEKAPVSRARSSALRAR